MIKTLALILNLLYEMVLILLFLKFPEDTQLKLLIGIAPFISFLILGIG